MPSTGKDKTPSRAPPRPSTPAPATRTQPSPPGAPQKPPSGSSSQLGRPATPLSQATKIADPSTPRTTGSSAKTTTGSPAKSTSGSPAKSAASSGSPAKSATGSPAKSTPGSATPKPQATASPRSSATLLPAAQLHEAHSKSAALTLMQAFSAPLPKVTKAVDFDPSLGHHTSSDLTQTTLPPQYWTEVDVGHYIKIADSYLDKPDVKSYLEKHCAPSLELTLRIRREADVVTFAALHLSHAVNMALGNVIFPNQIGMISEFEVDRCRVDCAWREANSRVEDYLTFAALEIKILDAIHVQDLYNARLTESQRAEQSKPGGQLTDPKFSHFTRTEVESMVKQITSYAHNKTFDTRYIALFDGATLFLAFFEPGAPGALVPLMRGTLIRCQGEHGNKARKALLGWLIEARKKKQEGNNRHIVRIPPKQLPERGLAHRAKKG